MLAHRAAMLARVRAFFTAAGVLEVDVPVLGEAGVTDLHIDNIEARVEGRTGYLQSSPEYYMKRLLAAGSGAIYYLGKAFRDGERGRRHNPEFTLLEWYRPGWDEGRLMAEIAALFSHLGVVGDPGYLRYRQVFEDALGLDPHQAALADLRQRAADLAGDDWSGETRSDCLDLLFSHAVEPTLPPGPVFITDYPACQCALASLGRDDRGNTVARRFEVFVDGVELGNGYYELVDAAVQQRRFEQGPAHTAGGSGLRTAACWRPWKRGCRTAPASPSVLTGC